MSYGRKCHIEEYNCSIVMNNLTIGDKTPKQEEVVKSVDLYAEFVNIFDKHGEGYEIVIRPSSSSNAILATYFLNKKVEVHEEWETQYDSFSLDCYRDHRECFSVQKGLDELGRLNYVFRVVCLNEDNPNMNSFADRFKEFIEMKIIG